jgi:hypothetical protein
MSEVQSIREVVVLFDSLPNRLSVDVGEQVVSRSGRYLDLIYNQRFIGRVQFQYNLLSLISSDDPGT